MIADKGASSRCAACGYAVAHKHRIIPGSRGGTYTRWNVLYLCANHHQAIHFLMSLEQRLWNDGGNVTREDNRKQRFYYQDKPLMSLWNALQEIQKTFPEYYALALTAMDETYPGAYDETSN